MRERGRKSPGKPSSAIGVTHRSHTHDFTRSYATDCSQPGAARRGRARGAKSTAGHAHRAGSVPNVRDRPATSRHRDHYLRRGVRPRHARRARQLRSNGESGGQGRHRGREPDRVGQRREPQARLGRRRRRRHGRRDDPPPHARDRQAQARRRGRPACLRQRSDEIAEGEDRVVRFALRVDGATHVGGPGDAGAPTRQHGQPPRYDRRVRDRARRNRSGRQGRDRGREPDRVDQQRRRASPRRRRRRNDVQNVERVALRARSVEAQARRRRRRSGSTTTVSTRTSR